ncbi:nucleoside diphosphate kinase regulator [Pontibaca salina]|uniref:Nucleoside diphosphate kinase regulator n=1 Tax=Pontibaca salina TaxID=2795731 RepID=A0A934HT65_9RHOB|nr:nucleoside diphosphate kinase regulator [Pontibaca salina]MBI6630937.1 nucleoside diphosphate kinase regulator [Pontibaca salina]
MTQTRRRAPRVTIDQFHLADLESLAEGAMNRAPQVADRLFEELGRAKIVKSGKLPSDVVTIGNTVTYRDETTGAERTVTLVYPQDADISQNRVSVVTPIGVALLGLSEGASFSWEARNDVTHQLTILKVVPGTDSD